MTAKKYPSDKQDQFIVRLPDGMRDRIKRAAERNNRSMNAEIVAVLERFYPDTTSREWAEKALRSMARTLGDKGVGEWPEILSTLSSVFDLPESRFHLLEGEDGWTTIRYDDGSETWMSIVVETGQP